MNDYNTTLTMMDNKSSQILPDKCTSYDPWIWFQEHYRLIHGYLAATICVGGLMANIANVVVLSRPKMKSPVNFLLMMIAIADMLLMLVYLPVAIYCYILADPKRKTFYVESRAAADFIWFYVSFTALCHTTAIWHTIAVATFRWLTLGWQNGKRYCSMKNAYICSFIISIANALLSIPNWVTNEVMPVTERDCETLLNIPSWTVGRKPDPPFNNWLFAGFGKLLPSLLLTVLTVLLINIMRKAEKRRQHLTYQQGQQGESHRHQEHNRTTGMLLAVVIIFLCIELPHGLFIIIMGDNSALGLVYGNIGEVIDIFTFTAFSINFFLYTIMSKKFRITFFSLFCGEAESFRKLSQMFSSTKPLTRKSTNQDSNAVSMTVTHDRNTGVNGTHLAVYSPLLGEAPTNVSEVLDVTL